MVRGSPIVIHRTKIIAHGPNKSKQDSHNFNAKLGSDPTAQMEQQAMEEAPDTSACEERRGPSKLVQLNEEVCGCAPGQQGHSIHI